MKKLLIARNSTADFLIFTSQATEQGIEVRYEEENLWLTQKMMAQLFDVGVPTINEHLKNIFNSNESLEKQLFGNSEQLPQTVKTMKLSFTALMLLFQLATA